MAEKKPDIQNTKPETELDRAMREVGIAEADLDNRPGQRAVVEHGDRIVFHCVNRAADGTISGHFEKTVHRK